MNNQIDDLPRRPYLRVAEVAGYLGCSERQIRRLCESQDLTAFRLGLNGDGTQASLRILRVSVLEFIRIRCKKYEDEQAGIISIGT